MMKKTQAIEQGSVFKQHRWCLINNATF